MDPDETLGDLGGFVSEISDGHESSSELFVECSAMNPYGPSFVERSYRIRKSRIIEASQNHANHKAVNAYLIPWVLGGPPVTTTVFVANPSRFGLFGYRYFGKPDWQYDLEKRRIPFPSDRLFWVDVYACQAEIGTPTERPQICDWGWMEEDADQLGHPVGWDEQLGILGKLWTR